MHIQDNTNTNNIVNAGFFIRLCAYLIDIIIIYFATLIIRIPMFFVSVFNPNHLWKKQILFEHTTKSIVFFIFTALYFTLMTYYKGYTLGKRLLGIKVVYNDSAEALTFIDVLYRETIGRYLSSLLFIGYILIGASNDKRGLHDILCDTRVVYMFNQ